MSDENFDIAVHVWIPRDRFKTLYQQSVKDKVEVRHLVRELIVEHVPGTPPAARPAPTATNDTDKHIARRNAEGANDLEIAEELGIGRHAVYYRRTRLGLPAAPSRGRPQKRGDS